MSLSILSFTKISPFASTILILSYSPLLSNFTFRVSNQSELDISRTRAFQWHDLHSSSAVSPYFIPTRFLLANINEETMDEEMEIMQELLADEDSFSCDIDSEYEFDADQFFDFSRGETESEADEAESWFRYAHEYPPSPFILKLKMLKAAKAKANQMKANKTTFIKKEAGKKPSTSSISDGGDIYHETPSKEAKVKVVKHHNQDNSKTKSKSTVNLSKPSGSSFMKPTASHLAKQNKERDTHSGGHGRVQKPLVSPGEKLSSPGICSSQATKRQKLEIGYLRKAAELKHRSAFTHKTDAEMECNSNCRCKITIPQKTGLVTEESAQKQWSHNKAEVVQQPKANTLNARPLNKKVLCKQISAPSVIEQILIQSQNFGNDKFKSTNNLKSCSSAKVHPIKDGGFMLNVKQNPNLPPIELFKKLSLKPESESKVISFIKPPPLSKGSKENVPRPFQPDFRRCASGKPNQCGTNRRITEVKT